MLEKDKHGNWWLEDITIEPWEITERWTKLVNYIEALADKNQALKSLVWEVIPILQKHKGNYRKFGSEGEFVCVGCAAYPGEKHSPECTELLAQTILNNPIIKTIMEEE
jgi:hypothetical protein